MTDEVKDKTKNTLAQPVRLGSKMNSFHQQVAAGAKVQLPTASAGTPSFADMSSTVIFPDCSGSMGDHVEGSSYDRGERGEAHDKAYFCREAVKTFIDNCFVGATKVGLASFPELVVVEPTHDLAAVKHAAQQIEPTGSTPMHDPLDFVLDEWSPTHGIVISDGSPDDKNAVLEAAKRYKAKGVKVDAVHIGSDTGGEELMKALAETTGGIYIKFTDVKAFAESFKYLTPKHRLTLTTSKNPTLLLNAAEVKI
jgi:uncharacterized protein YegL